MTAGRHGPAATRSPHVQSFQAIRAVRAAWGATLLIAPAAVLRILADRPPTRTPVIVLRVLGARHVVQSVLVAPSASRPVHVLASAVDLAHASTGAVLAAADARWRVPAALDATIATAFGVAGLRAATGGG